VLDGALSLQRLLDGEFGIQYGVGACKRDSSPGVCCIKKDDPFPATWICHFNNFELDSFVFHGRSSKRRRRKFLRLSRNECRFQLLRIYIRDQGHRCSDDGKGQDCKGKSDEFQAASVRHLAPEDVIQRHIEATR
jgi:hypothetical protein